MAFCYRLCVHTVSYAVVCVTPETAARIDCGWA
eukprot:COSAG02_NODE_8118_length_2701_cov_4.425442_1_plen_32_part_10